MKLRSTIYAILVALLLSACGGGSSSDSSDSQDDTNSGTAKTDVNVALKSNGASASAQTNSADANNTIDGNNATSWGSIDGQSIIVTFSEVNKVKSYTIKKNDGKGVSLSSSGSDIEITFSSDGSSYKKAPMSFLSANGISCTTSTLGKSIISCTLSEEISAKYIKVTMNNGSSFDFTDIEVISNK